MKNIFFDMDGTIADLYNVPNWKEKLDSFNPSPYKNAGTLVKVAIFSAMVNILQQRGYQIGIISWLSKNTNENYDKQVTASKINWLIDNFPLIKWDKIAIIPYGIDKSFFMEDSDDIIFDDSPVVRKKWKGQAYNEKRIFEILEKLLDN